MLRIQVNLGGELTLIIEAAGRVRDTVSPLGLKSSRKDSTNGLDADLKASSTSRLSHELRLRLPPLCAEKERQLKYSARFPDEDAFRWLPGPGGFLSIIGLAMLGPYVPGVPYCLDKSEIFARKAWRFLTKRLTSPRS